MALSILLNGSKGRMGQAVLNACHDLGVQVDAQIDVGEDPASPTSICASTWTPKS